jgi:hypothetical protein
LEAREIALSAGWGTGRRSAFDASKPDAVGAEYVNECIDHGPVARLEVASEFFRGQLRGGFDETASGPGRIFDVVPQDFE